LGLQVFDQTEIASLLRAFMLPTVLIYYLLTRNKKDIYFFFFLFFYSLSEFFNIFSYFNNIIADTNYIFYAGNLLYIAAYLSLVLKIIASLDLRNTLKRFPLQIVVLLGLGVYCVKVISDLLIENNIFIYKSDYYLVIAYNITLFLFLLSIFINYISSHTKKAMNLLLGALFIFLSEIIQFASFYVSETLFMNLAYFMFLVLAFYFFLIQSSMDDDENKLPSFLSN
jgi:hypothetical protein